MSSFGDRLSESFGRAGRLCVGVDPHPYLLSEWGLPDSAGGLSEFTVRVLDAVRGRASIIKPQAAFFERHGSAGIAVLEELFVEARAAGILVIADVKRGDVGTSVEAYAQAWLRPGSPLEADAMTVSAFQGFDSLSSVLELADEFGKGVFVLGATSNPEAAVIQRAVTASGDTVAAAIAARATARNDEQVALRGAALGSVGLVLGATLDLPGYGIPLESLRNTPILAPGFGHQGAKVTDRVALYGPAAGSVIVSASRSILSAGPGGIADAIAEQSADANAS